MQQVLVLGVLPTLTLGQAQEIKEIVSAEMPNHKILLLPGVISADEFNITEHTSTVKAPQAGEYV